MRRRIGFNFRPMFLRSPKGKAQQQQQQQQVKTDKGGYRRKTGYTRVFYDYTPINCNLLCVFKRRGALGRKFLELEGKDTESVRCRGGSQLALMEFQGMRDGCCVKSIEKG